MTKEKTTATPANEKDLPKDGGLEAQENQVEDSKTPQWKKEELLAIFDQIIFSGEYEEDFILGSKLKYKFRTRSAGDTSEITAVIDKSEHNLISTFNEQRAILNLAYSLVTYQGKNIRSAPAEERVKFIKSLPSVIVAALSDSLVKFDAKTDAACREGEAYF